MKTEIIQSELQSYMKHKLAVQQSSLQVPTARPSTECWSYIVPNLE